MENSGKYIKVNLQAGELYIAEKPTKIWTVLGSCLAVIFHNARLGIGAIAHAQLPEEFIREQKYRNSCPNQCFNELVSSNHFKFVACSIRYMITCFKQHGITTNEIDVKLFGGASILPLTYLVKSIGEQNVEVAYKIMKNHHLQLANEHVGGKLGRTIYFYSDTGEVLLKLHKAKMLLHDYQPIVQPVLSF